MFIAKSKKIVSLIAAVAIMAVGAVPANAATTAGPDKTPKIVSQANSAVCVGSKSGKTVTHDKLNAGKVKDVKKVTSKVFHKVIDGEDVYLTVTYPINSGDTNFDIPIKE